MAFSMVKGRFPGIFPDTLFGRRDSEFYSFSFRLFSVLFDLFGSFGSFGGDFSSPATVREGPGTDTSLDDTERITYEHPGRYEIKGEFGRGGIGRVLIAFDEHIGREVALKELLPEKGRASTAPAGISPSRFTMAMARFLRDTLMKSAAP